MLSELRDVFGEAARVFVLELHARRPMPVGSRELRHTLALDEGSVGAAVVLEFAVLRRMRAVAAARHGNGQRAISVRDAEMQGRERAHRQADDVCTLDAERIEYAADVVAPARL